MSGLSDPAVARLKRIVGQPEFEHPRYALGAPLGQGGMGAVYRAHDRELDREVAVKLIASPAPPPDAEDRLLDEARTLARLEHPGIVPVHDVGRLPDGRVFCVMKRVDGHRLDDPRHSNTPLADRLRVFERVCEAVAFAHDRGVLHRDLKPANVMVGAFGEVLVLDWGLAHLMSGPPPTGGEMGGEAGGATGAGEGGPPPRLIAGTAGYMAPEQAGYAASASDARSDVFALGGLLGFLATGTHPPEDSSVQGAAWPAADDASAPDRRLRAIVQRARAAAPAERYATVAELSADVARYRSAEPVMAYRENVFERMTRVAGRYQVALGLVAAYLIMRLVLLFLARR